MGTTLFYVKLGITRLSPSQLVERARALVLALAGNPGFPTPNPTMAAMTTGADAVETAEANVLNNGGRQDYLIRNERVQELRTLITLLGSYVQVTSGGSSEKILSAGFQTRRVGTPAGLLPAPGNLRALVSSLPGVINLRWDRVRHRHIYQVQICEGDPTQEAHWKPLVLVGRNAYSVTGLNNNLIYSFRVLAAGAAGPGPVSDPASERPK